MATDVQAMVDRRARLSRVGFIRRLMAFAEARPALAVFALALAVRVAVSVGIAIFHPQSIAPDGVEYSRLAASQATGHTAWWGLYEHYLYTHVSVLLVPITGLYEVFGVHQLIGQLYLVVLGAGTAGLTTLVGMELLPRRWALAVGLIVALLPTQIIWSSLILKDAAVWFTLTALALTVALAGRSRGLRLLILGLIAAGLLVLLGYLRFQTLVIASWALMLAAIVGPRRQWIPRVGGAVALGVLLPWLAFNLGPAGIPYVKSNRAPSDQRYWNAQSARTVIAPTLPAVSRPKTSPGKASPGKPSDTPPKPAPTFEQPTPTTPPAGTPTLGSPSAGEVSADARHLPQGILAMLVEPYPWQASGGTYLKLARADAMIWYPLLLLAFLGLLTLRPRHLRVMAFPLLAGAAILLGYALNEGNLGTAFRHRGEFEWVVALLAGFGLMRVAGWRSRSARAAPEPRDRADEPVAAPRLETAARS